MSISEQMPEGRWQYHLRTLPEDAVTITAYDTVTRTTQVVTVPAAQRAVLLRALTLLYDFPEPLTISTPAPNSVVAQVGDPLLTDDSMTLTGADGLITLHHMDDQAPANNLALSAQGAQAVGLALLRLADLLPQANSIEGSSIRHEVASLRGIPASFIDPVVRQHYIERALHGEEVYAYGHPQGWIVWDGNLPNGEQRVLFTRRPGVRCECCGANDCACSGTRCARCTRCLSCGCLVGAHAELD